MPRVRVALLTLTLLATACGDPDGPAPLDAADTEVGEPSTTTTSDPPAETSVLPSTSTIAPSADRRDDALQLMSSQWSTIEQWGDGWVEITATASGSVVQPRDSEVGQLFPSSVYDAIEAAGATDMVAAYDAVNAAGLLSEVLDVLDEHPEAWDVILAGPASLELSAATTTDGVSWLETPLPFFADGPYVASHSTGQRIAVATAPREARHLSVATADSDLTDWRVSEIATSVVVHSGNLQLAPLPDGWLVLLVDAEDTATAAWVIGAEGAVSEVDAPPWSGCCQIEDTDAGVVAWDSFTDDATTLAFSSDGIEWAPRPLPEPDQPVVGVAAVDDGVILTTFTDDGRTLHWRGAADATGWSPIGLPPEIEWNVWIRADHHRGVAQFVAVRGYGQRGYVPEPIPHTYEIEHDGMRIAVVSADQTTVTITDLDTGEVRYEEVMSPDGTAPLVATTRDNEVQFLDDGEAWLTVPYDLVTEAMSSALAEAEAALPAIDRAFRSATYLLHSPDGVEWSSTIVEPLGESSHPRIAASINVNRVLIGDFDEYRVIDLGGD